MKKIFKYKLEGTDVQVLKFPLGFKIISVIEQKDSLVLYVQVNPEVKELARYEITIIGTGNPYDYNLDEHRFFGSVKQGIFVWHIFGKHINKMKSKKFKEIMANYK